MRPSRVFASVPARARMLALAFAVAFGAMLGSAPAARAADPWLFVSDIHYDPKSDIDKPTPYGSDTNPQLMTSALDEMHRVAPNPPVIVIAGDFLSHHFLTPDALPTIVRMTRRLDALFPHTQFVLALGNEDSDCGDYSVGTNSMFLHAIALAWAPLVNRNGAAPDFVRTFSRDGFYTARLANTGVRAVVLDNAFWSPFYRDHCNGTSDPTKASLDDLDRALRPGGTERRWVVMHIPPGIDAASTIHRAKHLAIVPFMRPEPRDAALGILGDPTRHVEVVITGHIHHFEYRLIEPERADPVPLLVSPAISPIFWNNPSFLSADVAPDGRIRNLEEHSQVGGRWQDIGGLGSLGVSEFSGAQLAALQRRLGRDANLRDVYGRLFTGATPWHDINVRTWRSYWCESTEFAATNYRDCLEEGGFGFLTRRGVFVVGAALAAVVAVLGGLITLTVYVVRRRRRARATRGPV